MNLQTNTKTHILIFNDGSRRFLNQGECAFVYSQIEKNLDGFLLGDEYIRFSSIAKLLSVAEFHEQYPKERPQRDYIELPSLGGVDGIIKTADDFALKEMIIGLKRFISSTEDNPIINHTGLKAWYQGTKAPLELLGKMEFKLANVK